MKRWQQMTKEELKKYVPDPDGEIERLQEQLADANKLILLLKHHAICDFDRIIYGQYIDKWGVE